MAQEADWLKRLEEIKDRLRESDADWLAEWRLFNQIIEEAASARPEIKSWTPTALETFGEDVHPVDRVRSLVDEAIKRLTGGEGD